jgi:glycosyltransferase involved in cell wall biosynthesis
VILSGYKKWGDLKKEILKSMFVILPSTCFDNSPMAIMEAFSLGKPVIGSRIGGIPELVKDGKTGLNFEAGNIEDLRAKIKYLIDNPAKIAEMGKNARTFAEEELNSEKYYQGLMKIYNQARDKTP